MSVIAGVGKALGAEVLTAAGSSKGRVFLKRKSKLLVMTLAVGALFAFVALIAASEAPNAEHTSAVSANSQSQTKAAVSQLGAAPQMSKKEALQAYRKLPLAFVANEGQTDKAVRYYAQGAGYGFFFTKEGAVLSFAEGKGGAKGHSSHALALDFLGADPHATLEARKRLSGTVNYLVGDDPAEWQQGLPTHGELLYGGLWPGIDMAVRGEGGKLKYEFHLKPGSSVDDVRLAYRGAEGFSVGAGGELLVQTSLGVLKDAAPVSYQRIGGERVPVESHYKLTADGGYGFAVGAYDPRYPLIIDPGLAYSTFLGGGSGEGPPGIAVDESGRAYVTGITGSANFPTTLGAFDRTLGGFNDAFVTKLNASGTGLAYSTFLGGGAFEEGPGIAVDESGRAYVAGITESANFPTTPGAFDRTLGGFNDAYVTKLNASGTGLAYSTLLGGGDDELCCAIAVDESGRAYVTGGTRSADFPTTPGAFDRTLGGSESNAFVTKLNALGTRLAYSTFLGEASIGASIAVDERDRAYVTGITSSADFPTTPGAFDTTYNGVQDAFVTKLNALGTGLAYSTFLGGTALNIGSDIAVDESGRAYVAGITGSADFPTTPGAFDRTFNGGEFDAFVTKLPTG